MQIHNNITQDMLLEGRIIVKQWENSYRISSESVICAAFVHGEYPKIADFGAGVGALSLLLAHHGYDNIHAIEKETLYHQLLGENIKINHVDQKILALHGDIFQHHGAYDMIISNPPFYNASSPSPNYLKKIAKYEIGFTMKDWFFNILNHLNIDGTCYFIHGFDNIPIFQEILNNGHCQIIPLNVGNGKPIKRIIGKFQKSKPKKFSVLPDFFLHSDGGQFTEQAQKILRQAGRINPWEY